MTNNSVQLSLAESEDFVKILYYGEPGSGKTTALASLARRGPVVFLDAEAGLKARPLASLEVPLDKIAVRRDIEFSILEQLFFQLKARLEEDPGAVAGVVLDSLTEIQKKLLEQIVLRGVEKANRKGMERDQFTVYKEDWGVNTEQMRQLVRKFRDLPCHVGFSTLAKREQDDDGAVTYGPALTPAFQTDLMGYVDVMIYCRTEIVGGEEEFQGVCRRAGKFLAKDRFRALPRVLVDPTFDRVIAYIQGTLTVETDPVMTMAKIRRGMADEEAASQAEVAAS